MTFIVTSNLKTTLGYFCQKGCDRLSIDNIDVENPKLDDAWEIIEKLKREQKYEKGFEQNLSLKLGIDKEAVNVDVIKAALNSEIDKSIIDSINQYFQSKYQVSTKIFDPGLIESKVNLSDLGLCGHIELLPLFTPRNKGFFFDELIDHYVNDIAEFFTSGEVYVLYEDFEQNYGFTINDGIAEYRKVNIDIAE